MKGSIYFLNSSNVMTGSGEVLKAGCSRAGFKRNFW